MARILGAVVLITLIVSLLSIWFYPSMQDFMAANATWNGTRRFSIEFNAKIPESLDNLPAASKEAGQRTLIVIPILDYSEEELLLIRNFVDDGGTLLVLDDYGKGNTIMSYMGLGLRFSGASLLDPLFSYKNQRMPRAVDFTPQLKESGIDTITLNHATALVNVGAGEALAWSSGASFLDGDGNGAFGKGDVKGPFVVAAEIKLGKGNVIAVADPSIMIDSMVGKDNNYEFMRYLTRRGDDAGTILIDGSHLPKSPLDIAKRKLYLAQRTLSNPYALMGLLSCVFIAVYRYTLWGGESTGR